MKILAIHSIGWPAGNDAESGIDLWRVYRPMEELKKHVDWQIDYQSSLIYGVDKYKDAKEFTEEELEKAAKNLGKYDIIFSSYHPDPAGSALLDYVEKHYGTKYVMDVDDDMFSIAPHNPVWNRTDDWGVYVMQRMIRTGKYLTTTNDELKERFSSRSEVNGKVFVLPNYLPSEYRHPPVDNGKDVVIGYFGGASHYVDLHETAMLPALQRLMHEKKHVRFKCVGQPIDYYLPKKRTEIVNAVRGRDWAKKLFPALNMDIAVAPLEDSVFNRGKSNIKWQESTRAGAAFVCTNIEPYSSLKDDVAVKVANDENSWYEALKSLVDDAEQRKQLVKTAQIELEDNWRLEDHWQLYKQMFEEVYDD